MNVWTATLSLSVVLAVGATNVHAVNIIDATFGTGAGSFELGPYASNSTVPTDPFDTLNAGSTAITGWTVIGPRMDWLNNPNHLAFDGTKSLDLQGGASDGPCTINTVIPTVIGSIYKIDFDSYGSSLNQSASGKLSAGSLLNQAFVSPGVPDASVATYTHFSFSFTAQAASTTLSFTSVNSNGFGPVIDNVVVSPEPAYLAPFALASASLLLRRRRRAS